MSGIDTNEYSELSQKELEIKELEDKSKKELSNIFGDILELGDYQKQVDENPQLKDFLQGALHKNIDGFCNIMEDCVKKTHGKVS